MSDNWAEDVAKLRAAAQRIRDTAEGAASVTGITDVDPWVVEIQYGTGLVRNTGDTNVVARDCWPEEARHIAMWSPSTADAVADWLDAQATIIERLGRTNQLTRHEPLVAESCAVADAILAMDQS